MWKVYIRRNLTNPPQGVQGEWRVSAPVEYQPTEPHEKKVGSFETHDPEHFPSNCIQVNALTAHEAKMFARVVVERQRRMFRFALNEIRADLEKL